MRQNLSDECAEQAAREHARHDAAEQPEIVGENFQHAVDAAAPIDQHGADHDQHDDRNHRPADRLAGAAGAGFAFRSVGGGHLIFRGTF